PPSSRRMMQTMRRLVIICVLAGTASADSFLVIDGGLAIPISDKTWTNAVDPSLKIGARGGGGSRELAGLLSADFTPIAQGGNAQFAGVSSQRYRVQVGVQLWKEVAHNINIGGRFSVGVDIAHASYTLLTQSYSNTGVGFAAEP